MANIDVQPKRGSNWLLWLVLAIIILALLFLLLRGCHGTPLPTATTDSTKGATGVTTTGANAAAGYWDVDMNAPKASYDEITDTSINVRGDDGYGIYGMGENILFDEGKSTLRPDAEKNLKQIAASINKRFKGGNVRVYGYTDSLGTAGANKELAGQRAEAVRNWFSSNGGIPAGNISVNAVGEQQPVASNKTEEGRQQNRRVEVVAKKP